MAWADTPIHAAPLATMWSRAWMTLAAASVLAVTLSHSTHTVPLNRAGSAGRSTTNRVENGWSAWSITLARRPSLPQVPAGRYELAVP